MEKFKFLPKRKISEIPETAGVYAFASGRKLLYIGKAVSLKERVKRHRESFSSTGKLGYIKTDSEIEALLLEAKLIKKYQPKYNTAWKDDKKYFYVGITKEKFPRIYITHQFENRSRTEYVGPFVSGRTLKQTLKDLRKIYPYRTCKTIPKKPCLWYHLNQCPAPCLFRIKRLEAYDVSNIQGKDATGSMVTFVNGQPDKNFYRRFKIKGTAKPNDVAMLKEVLNRRLKHQEWPYPDLILIDGGKAQLNAAILIAKRYKLKAKIMALAKKENKLYVENQKNPLLLKEMPREIFNLILQARDEAHRFARKYHLKLRERALLR